MGVFLYNDWDQNLRHNNKIACIFYTCNRKSKKIDSELVDGFGSKFDTILQFQ